MDLLGRLNDVFASSSNFLFVQSFWTFLECDEDTDMVIDLDMVCKFIEARKDQAKRILVNNFKEGDNFVSCHTLSSSEILQKRGRPSECIMITPDTFKELCTLMKTAKAVEIRGCYIKMEKVLKQYLKERADVSHAEKELAEQKLAEATERQKQREYTPVPTPDIVYIMKEASELHSDRHKIGKAMNTKKRVACFNTGSARGVQIVHERSTHNAAIVEEIIQVIMKKYHFQREHYMCNIEHSVNTVDGICSVIDTFASCNDNMSRSDMFRKVKENLDKIEFVTRQTYSSDSDAELDHVQIEPGKKSISSSSVFEYREDLFDACCDKWPIQLDADKRKEMFQNLLEDKQFEDIFIRVSCEFSGKTFLKDIPNHPTASSATLAVRHIRNIYRLLGIKHTFDTQTTVPRATIENNLVELDVECTSASRILRLRDQSKTNVLRFEKLKIRLNKVLGNWSGMVLVDPVASATKVSVQNMHLIPAIKACGKLPALVFT